jgi:hypothetical protein
MESSIPNSSSVASKSEKFGKFCIPYFDSSVMRACSNQFMFLRNSDCMYGFLVAHDSE